MFLELAPEENIGSKFLSFLFAGQKLDSQNQKPGKAKDTDFNPIGTVPVLSIVCGKNSSFPRCVREITF